MSYNTLILNKIDADAYMANILDKGLAGVKQEAFKQAQLIHNGYTRIMWYSSCLFDNYQDVCSRLKKEDVRFAKAIVKLIKQRDTIREMLAIFINYIFDNLSDHRIKNIILILSKAGAIFNTSTLTRLSLGYSISAAVSTSLGCRASVESALTTWATRGVAVAGIYGYVQVASNAAGRLLHKSSRYYKDLYNRELEMLYFLIEPVINRVDVFNQFSKTDQEIAADILRITQ